ncbi:MAG: radical SAM protein [Alphaproteobacteria bacterium]|nr:radical SAM protein [Alphaproteobacteria bacterium]
MRVALILPPLTQLNTPYPATAYLARALRERGVHAAQRDLGLELALAVFTGDTLWHVFEAIEGFEELPEPAWRAIALRDQHEAVIDPVVAFLQGKDRSLASRILDTPFLPLGPRLAAADLSDFGPMATDDAARHLATLYLADVADLITATVDEGFALTRYHHHLAVGPASFDRLAERLSWSTLIDHRLDALIDTIDADVVGLSVPFPGNLYGALRVGQRLKARGIEVLMGGGYVNTELRAVDEPRLWQYVDALCYDDGEGPLLAWLDHRSGGPDKRHRTRTAEGLHDHPAPRVPMTPAAWYGDLPLDDYLDLIDTLNPAHRLWADGRWNKITLAHGCYWKRCAFCDVELDYIARFEPAEVRRLVDCMVELIEETGQSGFHFVDEAAPPRLMKALALELLQRGVTAVWWGNIRFERAFTPDLCRLLAAAGLVAVTGGLEVASDRLLQRMDKGVTVAQVARAAQAFRRAGVMVHAYLMYGFPTQTEAETVESMERVRQLFAEGALSSAFWHRFVLTRHSRIFRDPDEYGVTVIPHPASTFASNDLAHADPQGGDHDRFDAVLPLALEAWMRGQGLHQPVHAWFDPPTPPAEVPPTLIRDALAEPDPPMGEQLVWLGGGALTSEGGLTVFHNEGEVEVRGRPEVLRWVSEVLGRAAPGSDSTITLTEARASFPGDWAAFAPQWSALRAAGLVGV